MPNNSPTTTEDRWSAPLGLWFGIGVRLHVTLVLVVVLALGATFHGLLASDSLATDTMAPDTMATEQATGSTAAAIGDGLASDRQASDAATGYAAAPPAWTPAHTGIVLTIYLLSLVLHESAHLLVVNRLGGRVDRVVLTPVGGIASPSFLSRPESRLVAAMAGPLVNLSAAVLATVYMVALEAGAEGASQSLGEWLLPSLDASVWSGPIGLSIARLALWCNWLLFLVNLAPAYPFDGAPALRSWLWPRLGRRPAAETAGQIGRLLGLVVALMAMAMLDRTATAPPPLWAPLAVFAVLVFFGAQRDLIVARESTHDDPHHGLSVQGQLGLRALLEGDASGEVALVEFLPSPSARDESETLSHSLSSRSDDGWDDPEPPADMDDEAQVDSVLAKLHAEGYERLSDDERETLHRASRRYQRRRLSN
ncbi:Peptidase family M50 [Pseudobythopirellula maris]|uniref:Peptidase family M50 n=1 Tax=Pseudobythopirellula maris TaxID=2527991 RepID=A0A5C5ZS10_9BACT|nr:site-2 protease family protein [Pseudobythopirellula maris]TWT90322.1 Peptidase family M50 [Pseudobythopirellula maris]